MTEDAATPEDGSAADAEDAAAKKPLVKKLLIPLIGAIVSAGLAFALSGILAPAPGDGEEEEEEAPEFGEPFLLNLPQVQTTLADLNKQSFAKVTMILEVEAVDEGPVRERVTGSKLVVLQDALHMNLSGRTSEQMKSQREKELLKLELMDLLNPILFEEGDGRILAVYYQEVMIQ